METQLEWAAEWRGCQRMLHWMSSRREVKFAASQIKPGLNIVDQCPQTVNHWRLPETSWLMIATYRKQAAEVFPQTRAKTKCGSGLGT